MRLKIVTVSLLCAMLAVLMPATTASASAIQQYGLVELFDVPDVADISYFTMTDCLTDGRLVSITGRDIYVESFVGSRNFEIVATFEQSIASSVDPSFIRVSPDGAHIALGLGWGQPVAIVNTTDLGTAASPTLLTDAASGGNTKCFQGLNHYDAEWQDNAGLAIDGGGFSYSDILLLDTTSDTAAPDITIILTNVGGASGGVTFGPDGALYTGNAYDYAGIDTGLIKRFSAAEVAAAIAGATPLDFQVDGIEVIDALSAASLGFDLHGNFYVGGGDAFGGSGDYGYFGLLSSEALADIVAGTPFAPGDYLDGSKWATFDPAGTGDIFSYMVNYNDSTCELMAFWTSGFSSPGVDVHAAAYAVPEPTTLLIASLGSILTLAARGRKAWRTRGK